MTRSEAPGEPVPDPTDAASVPEPKVKKSKPPHQVWLTPVGISAIAAVLAAIVAVIGLFAQRAEPAPAPAGPLPTPGTLGTSAPAEPALFVYGSSMPGMSRYDVIGPYVLRSARDTVRGSLHDSGLGYPMARFDGSGVIRGVVLWLDPATAQAALTEMTRVEAGLFHPVQVRTASGVTAQAYEWIGATDGFPRIDAWDGSTAHYGARLRSTELSVGDCFQIDDDSVLTVWCDAPHPWQAFHTGTVEGVTNVEALVSRECDRAFDGFVGRPPDRSELLIRTFVEPAGQTGGRRYLCALAPPTGSEAGTLKGADR